MTKKTDDYIEGEMLLYEFRDIDKVFIQMIIEKISNDKTKLPRILDLVFNLYAHYINELLLKYCLGLTLIGDIYLAENKIFVACNINVLQFMLRTKTIRTNTILGQQIDIGLTQPMAIKYISGSLNKTLKRYKRENDPCILGALITSVLLPFLETGLANTSLMLHFSQDKAYELLELKRLT